MATRDKRSVSLPPDLAQAIDEEAAREGSTFSAWIAETAARRLKLDAARRAITEWEAEHGAFTAEEITQGLTQARASLELSGEEPQKRSA